MTVCDDLHYNNRLSKLLINTPQCLGQFRLTRVILIKILLR